MIGSRPPLQTCAEDDVWREFVGVQLSCRRPFSVAWSVVSLYILVRLVAGDLV